MDSRKIQGVPWHPERMHRAEDDDRRYKGRCKFHSYEEDYCSRHNGRCMGSAHCDDYVAISDAEFKAKQMQQRKPKKSVGEDDCYWY